ncbi:hypothetical protein RCG19_03290 [Neobacillus sp. OS1-2]|uniref:hypothetical protein n=1 Tax=Neobacillus sp. OS1-2 TaxID=3070680 RepID=UPI0027E169D3|nr:hypothetical protein [Neobacillus sp. OS1-2]WML40728.1 hypothetical protein RCG19_03290 [Neobacillus sp. OS1-2]
MINNQKGNALITVMLISLVFTALGLAIVSTTISGTKRLENRKTDINLSYNSVKVVEEITTNITKSLDSINLKSFMDRSSGELTIYSSFGPALENMLHDSLNTISANDREKIECLSIVDESGDTVKEVASSNICIDDLSRFKPYHIKTDQDFTRVFEIVLITKNPNQQQGKITRTIRKRIILSPLPSFLKYAVGSTSTDEDSGLFLNGSPNLNGNVYGNKLTINEDAKYQLRDTSWKTKETPMPSIVGDLYSSTANLLPVIKNENNFYKKDVPALKHDSQFVDINFAESFKEQTNKIAAKTGIFPPSSAIGSAFKEELINNIKVQKFSNTPGMTEINKEDVINKPLSIVEKGENTLIDSYMIESGTAPINYPDSVTINGDLVVMSSGNSINFGDDLVVDGDLYVVSYKNISLKNIFVTGDIHLINFDGKLLVNDSIICGGTLAVESNAAYQTSNGIELNGDIITGGNLSLYPIDTTIKVNKNIVINGAFTILGNDELAQETEALNENDEVIFSSVVYVGGTTSISNVNILGAENRELILLGNKDLMITRINEFQNFDPLAEKNKEYLPEIDNTIKPLKAFFYTEANAELYGVGSLFYIDGGLFAKKRLEINAIRGEVKNINNLPSRLFQEDKLSRFIVHFNDEVLLQKIDALPIVEHLQIYSDELIIE